MSSLETFFAGAFAGSGITFLLMVVTLLLSSEKPEDKEKNDFNNDST